MQLRQCVKLALLVGSGFSLRADILYSVTDLGTLGGPFSDASGINVAGQVVGSSDTAAGTFPFHAFIYTDGHMTDLGTLGGSYSYGRAINDIGQAVGFAETSTGYQDAFLYSNGHMIDLGPGSAFAINNAGQVVGGSNGQAFLYNNGQMTDLGPRVAFGINDSGQVVGQFADNFGNVHAFLYGNGQMTDLGPGEALGINNSGQVVGLFWDNFGNQHAFLYSNGHMTDLGPGLALGINDRGQVVGASRTDGTSSAFLYVGQLQDLSSLIDPALRLIDPTLRGSFAGAGAINDQGQIVADTGFSPVANHAYLLTPVPELNTLALLGTGFTALLPGFVIRRRKMHA